ncbi:hypothetical protein CLOM621_07828 [Clostridium sp. M62/1]|nr:hypothetical protein CLOM621_07828 [Clostridium sp. M62/1]
MQCQRSSRFSKKADRTKAFPFKKRGGERGPEHVLCTGRLKARAVKNQRKKGEPT